MWKEREGSKEVAVGDRRESNTDGPCRGSSVIDLYRRWWYGSSAGSPWTTHARQWKFSDAWMPKLAVIRMTLALLTRAADVVIRRLTASPLLLLQLYNSTNVFSSRNPILENKYFAV